MKPFEKILVPVDFSPHAAEAVRYAIDLAGKYQASITLFHVFEPPSYVVPAGFVLFQETAWNNAIAEWNRRIEETKKEVEAGGIQRVETSVQEGIASVEIGRKAREGQYDLIIMGTHGRSGIKHALIGSVAERVVRHAPCPVLTVRFPAEVTR